MRDFRENPGARIPYIACTVSEIMLTLYSILRSQECMARGSPS